MSDKCRLPPSSAAQPRIIIEESDPIVEPEAPGGEIKTYKIKHYDGQRWRSFQIVNHAELVEFHEDVAELLNDSRGTEDER
jgi:hypothetical protein